MDNGNNLYSVAIIISWNILNLSMMLIIRGCSVRLSCVSEYIPGILVVKQKIIYWAYDCVNLETMFELQLAACSKNNKGLFPTGMKSLFPNPMNN
jgi:hypothetical protein